MPSYPTKDNCFGVLYPQLAEEWHTQKNHPLTPYCVKAMSGRKVWWRCEVAKDHIWEASVADRSKGYGCPCCRGLKVVDSNSLKTKNPTLAAQWHFERNGNLTPDLVTHKSGKKVWWICDKDSAHQWLAIIALRSNGNGCPFCDSIYRKKDKKPSKPRDKKLPLSMTHPCALQDWDFDVNTISPSEVTAGSGKKVSWICKNDPDHKWEMRIWHRVIRGDQCPHCKESKGEKAISARLDELGIAYKRQFRFDNCKYKSSLPFDFIILVNGRVGLIEFQGIQHYEKVDFFGGKKSFELRLARDKAKRDFCNMKGLSLLEIPYYKIADIDEIVLDFVKKL